MSIEPRLQQSVEGLAVMLVLQAESFVGASQYHVIQMHRANLSLLMHLQRNLRQRNIAVGAQREANGNQCETGSLEAQLLEQLKQFCFIQLKAHLQTANEKHFRNFVGRGCKNASKTVHGTAEVVVMFWDSGIMVIENCSLSQQLAEQLVPSSSDLPAILILSNIQKTFEIILQTQADHTRA